MDKLTDKQKAFDMEMKAIASDVRYRWCNPGPMGCACTGCVNNYGKITDYHSWLDWVDRHPEPEPLPITSSIYQIINKRSDLPK